MTIYTAEQALNPSKSDGGHGVDVALQMEKEALTADYQLDNCDSDWPVYNDTTVPVIIERRRSQPRRRLWLQLLLFGGMVVGLTLCILGSLHLYSNMYYVGFVGRCGVGIVLMPNISASAQALEQSRDAGALGNPTPTAFPWGGTDYDDYPYPVCRFEEDIEINGPIETMKVPRLNTSSAATIRHDFDRNMTAIRDELRKLCFIVPLLAEFTSGLIPKPSDFSSYLQHRTAGEHLPLVHEADRYFDVDSTITDVIDEYGAALGGLCDGVKPLRAEPRPGPALSVGTTTTTTTESTLPPTTEALYYDQNPMDVWYRMYPGGDALFNYHMLMLETDWLEDIPTVPAPMRSVRSFFGGPRSGGGAAGR